VEEEEAFYRLPADLFHLAVQPEDRQRGLGCLLSRVPAPPAILNEKPMAAPEDPARCTQVTEAVDRGGALMLFDFPELFDPLTERAIDYLRQFRDVRFSEFRVRRSKDREAADKPRNYKRMVPIQYQESVHCLAFVLYLLARLRGSVQSVLDRGLSVRAVSEPYRPPNPEIYPYQLDGRCQYQLTLGPITVDGLTDFKAGSAAVKERILAGTADGRPFRLELNFQEGQKWLRIDGEEQGVDPAADSYDHVLRQFHRWQQSVSRKELMSGVYPNPRFARVTYQLSSVLWRASYDRQPLRLASLSELLAFEAGFREAIPAFAKPGR
jgi:hypothetical protein